MPVNINVKDSPGWWLKKAFAKRASRMPRLSDLNDWLEGNPPAPTAVKTAREAFAEFEEEAVTNLADLIVSSARERMTVRDIRTSVSGDAVDEEAAKHWAANNMDVEISSVIHAMLGLGDAYTIVGTDEDTDEVTITFEDPRDIVTFHDPVRQSRVRAGAKFLRDADDGRDYVTVVLPGSKKEGRKARQWVAFADIQGEGTAEFDPETWSWDPERGGAEGEALLHHLVPFVRFRNRNGLGEFEPHMKVLRRINRLTFQLTVIVMYQAYKQRAVILDDSDATDVQIQNGFKEEIGLDGLDDALTSDPGSWFLLPRGAKIWESTQADIQGILSAISDDFKRLAAVTRRPMAIFAPDNQSANGADFSREGLTFSVEDKIVRVTQGIIDTFHLVFLTAGDEPRAEKTKIIVGWKPTERFSLPDRASATSQVVNVLPKRTILREIWQMTPAEIEQVEQEASDEALLLGEITGDDADAATRLSPEEATARSTALGILVRAGVKQESAAAKVGLADVEFSGATPVSLRPPANESQQVEDRK